MSSAPKDAAHTDPAWIWTQYWKGPRLACCFGDSEGQYDAELINVWRSQFEHLPKGARLLDLCTGNGAVPLMAADFSAENQLGFSITGIDKADIDPEVHLGDRFPRARDITFLPNVDVSNMPFKAATFDCVTSQFGLEYTNWSACLPHIRNVLNDTGRAVFIMHANQGDVWRAAKAELDHVGGDAPLELITLALEYCDLDAACRAPNAAPATLVLRDQNAALMNRKFELAANGDNTSKTLISIAKFVHQTLSALLHHGHSTVRTKLNELRESIEAHTARSQALVSAALTQEDIQDLVAQLTALDFRVERTELLSHSRFGQIGWLVSAALDPSE